MDVMTLPSGTLAKLEFFFLLIALTCSSLNASPTTSSFFKVQHPHLPLQHLNISLLPKFASYLHSDTYSWDYFLRRCCLLILSFLDWHCGGTLQYGLEFEVIACILMCDKCVENPFYSNTHLIHMTKSTFAECVKNVPKNVLKLSLLMCVFRAHFSHISGPRRGHMMSPD